MRRILALSIAVTLAVLAVAALGPGRPARAAAYKPEFKLSLVVNDQSPWGQAAIKFADALKERTQGRINVKNYFAGQLFAGKQTNEFLLLNQGVADFALGSTINWSPQVKELNLFALPFLFPGYKALDAVEAGEPGKRLFQLIEAKGVVPIAWGENGFREVTNSKRAVKRPEDLDGLKVRVVGSPIFIEIFRALGANPVNMNWGEAQTAFQQGTVDGQENPIASVIIPYKLWQAHKHITFWHYAIDPVILAVSGETWKTLSPEDREIVRKTGEEVMAWEKKAAREGLEGAMTALDTLKKNGMEVVELSPEQLKPFRDKTRPVYEKWTQEVGVELVRAAEKLVEANR
ncbi:MAG: DctP family TRAP transporter solute-binding subunit [Candidatus Rokubacteria bacterium]|nr:DctP family TRAP transporter solute-binding subunit [Candidatus Rokubacteria bacterium]